MLLEEILELLRLISDVRPYKNDRRKILWVILVFDCFERHERKQVFVAINHVIIIIYHPRLLGMTAQIAVHRLHPPPCPNSPCAKIIKSVSHEAHHPFIAHSSYLLQ